MNATEYIKLNGWTSAKYILKHNQKNEVVAVHLPNQGFSGETISISDLKRLVESHELINRFRGIEKAKRELKLIEEGSIFRCCIAITAEMLKQAISDVEACQ